MSEMQNVPESPGAEHEDDVVVSEQPDVRVLSPAGQSLMSFLTVMQSTGDDAEEEYRAALEELRRSAKEVIIEIARMEQGCKSWDYPTRWALIYAASELRHSAALPLFQSIVRTPIPPEQSADPHSFSTVAEETILRTTAVDGVSQLAENGDSAAIDALLDFLSVPSISVKRAAVQGLLNVQQGESLRGRIEDRLCPEDKYLLDIRPMDVRKVTQIDNPEDTIDEPDREADRSVTPDLPDRKGKLKSSGKDSGDAPSC